MIRFDDQVAIVTGAGRGIGRSHAIELARRGARVVVNDVGFTVAGGSRDAAVAQAVVDEIVATGGMASADTTDVSNADECDALIAKTIDRFGRIDIVVNNAGNIRFLNFAQTSRADFDALVDTHLGGTFNVTRAAWPQMVRQNYGRLVFTTSQIGFYGQVDAVAYGAAKSGIMGLMHGIKLDSEKAGIRVNCISPFAVTRMVVGQFPSELEKHLAPEHISAAVAYLASRECTLNGEILIACGGHLAVARTIETEGIDIDDPAGITADAVAARIEAITDASRFKLYADAPAAVQGTFDRLKRRTGAPG
jgi:NAD(P)-dependent dehydrogenase (short-subunit alcohol dehydrogenase family)